MQGVVPNQRIVAFGWRSLNPMHWLVSAVSTPAQDGWEAAMIGIFSVGMWVLRLAFHIIDAFTTPDLTANGPLGAILPTTAWIDASLAGTCSWCSWRWPRSATTGRPGAGRSSGCCSSAPYGWVPDLRGHGRRGVHGPGTRDLSVTLHVSAWSRWTMAWPKKITDVTVASVLGLFVGPIVGASAVTYLLLMLVREASLLVLAATSPITSAGLLSEVSRT